MLNNAERRERGEQNEGCLRRWARGPSLLAKPKGQDRASCHRKREKQVERAIAEVAFQMFQMARQKLLGDVRHTEENVELGREAHRPEDRKGP
jgi:hypothetical protein